MMKKMLLLMPLLDQVFFLLVFFCLFVCFPYSSLPLSGKTMISLYLCAKKRAQKKKIIYICPNKPLCNEVFLLLSLSYILIIFILLYLYLLIFLFPSPSPFFPQYSLFVFNQRKKDESNIFALATEGGDFFYYYILIITVPSQLILMIILLLLFSQKKKKKKKNEDFLKWAQIERADILICTPEMFLRVMLFPHDGEEGGKRERDFFSQIGGIVFDELPYSLKV